MRAALLRTREREAVRGRGTMEVVVVDVGELEDLEGGGVEALHEALGVGAGDADGVEGGEDGGGYAGQWELFWW